jgi:Fic/DOC family
MSPKILAPLPEVFLSDSSLTQRVSRGVAQGQLRKLGPRLYTTQVELEPAEVVRRHWSRIVGLYFPGAVIGYRTVLDGQPAKEDGAINLTATVDDEIRLPGHRLRVSRGPGPLEGDMPYPGNVHWASPARALLEAARPSRARAGASARGYRRPELEDWLERQLQLNGESGLNRLRDEMRRLTQPSGGPALLEAEPERLEVDEIIGILLGTREERRMSAPTARARVAGAPYDSARVVMMRDLHAALSTQKFPVVPDPAPRGRPADNLAFLDAYFSNYIEGTTFEVGEAREIIFLGKQPPGRPADAHDIQATYDLVRDPQFMQAGSRAWNEPDAFVTRLEAANALIMRGRPGKLPGQIKQVANRAGNTVFVDPTLVRGTIQECYGYVTALSDPFARAVALMFLITEVHPFTDGNGRCARAFMNAELVAAGYCRVLIPTVFRDDYVGALRVMTRQQDPEPLIKALSYAQRFVSEVPYDDLDEAIELMTRCNAFQEDDNEEDLRLRLPSMIPGAAGSP